MGNVTIIETEKLNSILNGMEALMDFVKDATLESKFSKKTYMSLMEVSEYIGFSEKWVRDHKHDIGCSKVGGDYRFKRSDVDYYVSLNYFKIETKKRRAS